jgi:hypothetical protein
MHERRGPLTRTQEPLTFSRLSNHEKNPRQGGRVSPRQFIQRFELSDADESEGHKKSERA